MAMQATTKLSDNHKPKPDSVNPLEKDLHEGVIAVKDLGASIREFPEGFSRHNHLSEVSLSAALILGVLGGLLVAGFIRKDK
jgi:hypothetical protein